jgi:transcriptional regulator with XRE-family HTH domain
MTNEAGGRGGREPGRLLNASSLIAQRLKEARTRRRMTAKQLAERCAGLGAPRMSAYVIANIETGRREVSVEDLFLLAYALDVAPTFLVALPQDPPTALALTAEVHVTDPATLARWVRGDAALPGTDAEHYYSTAPERTPAPQAGQAMTDYARAVLHEGSARLASQFEAEAAQFISRTRGQVREMIGELRTAVAHGAQPTDVLEYLDDAEQRLAERPAGNP